jgi:hypothetical protein
MFLSMFVKNNLEEKTWRKEKQKQKQKLQRKENQLSVPLKERLLNGKLLRKEKPAEQKRDLLQR